MAFFQDPARQPLLRVPAVIFWLIAVFIAIHALRTALYAPDSTQTNYILETYGLIPAWYSPHYLVQHGIVPRGLGHQVLSFFTYMFLHGSWSHLLVNSVWLLAFGPVVVRRFGTFLFLAFFVLCGLAGAATHLAVYWASTAPVIGASAAISGLMGAGFRMLSGDAPGRPPLAPLFSTRILVWSGVWVLVNVIAGVTGLGAGPGIHLVAWEAHMGGYFAGLLLSGPFDGLARR